MKELRLRNFVALILILSGIPLNGQDATEKILKEIETNNLYLEAYRKHAEAERAGSRTGISLQNPVAGFNYLWGDPAVIGNRTDISIKQSFDFPAAYAYKRQIAGLKTSNATREYEKLRNELLTHARIICIGLVYANAMRTELRIRLEHAQSLADAYRAKFEAGEINIIDYNKAQVNYLNLRKEYEVSESDRKLLNAALTALNGGKEAEITDSIFTFRPIPDDFESWYASVVPNNSEIQQAKIETEIGQKQEKLSRALTLPKFEAGYMSEKVAGEQFQGITAGIAIPLWENRYTVKYARTRSEALQLTVISLEQEHYHNSKALYAKLSGLKASIDDYRKNIEQFDNIRFLSTALEKGEISLTDYLNGLSFQYESKNRLLSMEKDFQITWAELFKYGLSQ